MMNRYKMLLIGLLSLVATNLLAQQSGKIECGFNVENFPEVSFVYHTYNPEPLCRDNFFYLKEGTSDRCFTVENLPVIVSDLPQRTLVLWEDMAHNGFGQFDFTKKTLQGFFSRANISASDKFAIAAFNRRKNKSSALVPITNGFTGDRDKILSAINGYKRSMEHYPEFPNRSDMYTAIREGMEILAPLKDVKAIIVFTSGYAMRNSGSDSEAQVLLKAQQLHIPVYIFQYYYKSGVASASEGFAKSTFGAFNSYKDVTTAETALMELYPRIVERYQGRDYKITFTSDIERGAEPQSITLSVGGVEVQEQLLPPPHTVFTWIVANPWWVALIVIVLIALIIGIILFVWKIKRNEAENRRELANLEQRRIQDKEEAAKRQREMEHRANEERAVQQSQAENDRLSRLMAVKNMYPRLRCQVGSNAFIYEITKPRTSVGREQDNDVVLCNNKVSRKHAEIVFNGSAFEIVDNHSTNKVIVNGLFVERTILKSGDIIGLGEAVITFMC